MYEILKEFLLIKTSLAEFWLISFLKSQIGINKYKNLETNSLYHNQIGGVSIFLSQKAKMFC